jgi:transposase
MVDKIKQPNHNVRNYEIKVINKNLSIGKSIEEIAKITNKSIDRIK